MSIKEYIWKSSDGLALYAVQWPATGRTEAVVAFVHGHGDHCRRYDEWFSVLNSRNIAVLAFDYRGHGRSDGKRGTIGQFEDLGKDVALLCAKAAELNPSVPVVLYGHSLGATLVISHLIRSKSLPALAIATSPWLQLAHPPGKYLSALIKIANQLLPNLAFSTGLHPSDFSMLEGYAEKGGEDKYIHNRISPRFYSSVVKEIVYIFSHFSEITVPLLLMQGRDDKVMDGSATKKLSSLLPGQVKYFEWKYAGHQLHNSESSDEIMEYIIEWIKMGI